MLSQSEQKSLIAISFVLIFVVTGTYGVTLFARGYRPNYKNPSGFTLSATGLLSATSKPKGASVFIDDRLVTATDDTINLPPSEYVIKIIKDGYLPWQKTIKIKKEIVFQTDAQLFRSTPDLSPVTLSGAINPEISPDNSKLIFAVASASATVDNGLFLIELGNSPLSLTKNTPRQLAPNFPNIDWSKATFTFSPNSRQVLVTFSKNTTNFLINIDSQISQKNLLDITAKLSLIKLDWQNQEKQLTQIKLERLPLSLQSIVSTSSAKHVSFSPDDNKILYLANKSANLPENIITAPPAQSTQTQSRHLIKDNYYVYDIKDDTNYLIGNSSQIINPFWLPNSDNVAYVENNSIMAVDFDSTNKATLFNGTFKSSNVFPWSDGTKIITLTSAYSGSPENLYAITIR